MARKIGITNITYNINKGEKWEETQELIITVRTDGVFLQLLYACATAGFSVLYTQLHNNIHARVHLPLHSI